MPGRKPRVVLTAEQALAMPYATLRFVHLGWRVIRLEPTPVPGRQSRGDPNRHIGRPIGGADRHSYFVAPNVGKEAVALNLKHEEGRSLLRHLIRELEVDVFCTNTLPKHHDSLGLGYDTLRAEKEDLIWCSISAQGLAYSDVPGYDPVVQALCGYMDLTGHADGPPLQCGLPITDLKAGDEAFAQVLLALMDRAETGVGRQIDISMAQVAVSWLQTFLPMLDMGSPPEELSRCGNEHRQFIPVNAYRTSDGFVFMAIGSDAQWNRFVAESEFCSLSEARFATNEGRRQHKHELHRAIESLTRRRSSAEVAESLRRAGIPHAPVTPIQDVSKLPFVAETTMRTVAPDGRQVRLPPPACATPYLENRQGVLPFCPDYGEHTDSVLAEVGVSAEERADLRSKGIVA